MKKKPKVALYPDRIEREYERLLRGYVLGMSKETLAKLKDMELLRLDSWSEDVTALFLLLSAQFLMAGESLTLRLPGIYAQVNQFQDQQWRLVVKSGTGITIPAGQSVPYGMTPYGSVSDPNLIRARFGMGIDVYRSEPWLAARQANWVAQNTALIKSIAPQYMTSVETIVRQGVMSGTAPKVLAKQIQQASGVTMKRATLIARDQIGKANGELTQHRQMDLGITDYIWDTSHDERVRPAHKARDQKPFKWSDPPSDGHPGYPVRCRCRALAQFDDEND